MTKLETYEHSIRTIFELISEDNQLMQVPACPEWTLRDLAGHLVGATEDVANENFDGFGQPHWTAAQVERHADLTLEELKAHWNALPATLGDRYQKAGEFAVPDVVTHEYDVRGAVGNTEERDASALLEAVRFFVQVNGAFNEGTCPPLLIHVGGDDIQAGEGEPQGELTITPFEASRVLTGRRSVAQIRALDWSVDPEPWLEAISVLPPRESDLVE